MDSRRDSVGDATGPHAGRVVEEAVRIFGDRDAPLEWLGAPICALGDRTPESMMRTDEGIAAVEAVLGRLSHGVYS
ncbi:MAG: DUF2384 domain-containing protein [Dehalococcoidia bacterium]|nr:DUF2384 domain-containing protein [Dehalococcoidia bacterium]